MTSDEAAPRDPLRGLAKANIILGIASLIRFGPELVLILQQRPDGEYLALLAMDLVIAGLWLKSGLSLRKHSEEAIRFVSIAGAVIFAHGGASGYFFGRELLRFSGNILREPQILAFIGSRFLIYAIEFAYWPFALIRLSNLASAKGRRPEVVIIAAWSFVIAAVAQSIVLSVVF